MRADQQQLSKHAKGLEAGRGLTLEYLSYSRPFVKVFIFLSLVVIFQFKKKKYARCRKKKEDNNPS